MGYRDSQLARIRSSPVEYVRSWWLCKRYPCIFTSKAVSNYWRLLHNKSTIWISWLMTCIIILSSACWFKREQNLLWLDLVHFNIKMCNWMYSFFFFCSQYILLWSMYYWSMVGITYRWPMIHVPPLLHIRILSFITSRGPHHVVLYPHQSSR